jgi:tetratricopeptide (TPR) repeat protein
MDAETSTLETLAGEAFAAEKSGDLASALHCWRRVCDSYPNAQAGYLGCGRVLKELDDVAASGEILAKGIARCPPDAELGEQYAWNAFHSRDWAQASERWAKLRTQFPDSFIGWAAGATALRHLGQYDAAETLYLRAFELRPSIPEFGLMADYAELAQVRGQTEEASKRWASLRSHFPDHSKGYVRDAQNLSAGGKYPQAETLLEQALMNCGDQPEVLIELARIAECQDNLQATLIRWEAVLKSFPELVEGYLGAVRVLFDLGRFADALNTLRPALRMFPESMHIADLRARIAYRLDCFEDALELWSAFRQRWPQNPSGYCGEVDALTSLSRFSEADSLITEARSRFPLNEHVAVSWCLVTERLQKYDDAEFRWGVAYARFPSFHGIRSGYARILSHNGKFKEAESILQLAVRARDADLDLLATYAHCASDGADWSNAETRWQAVIEQFPNSATGWIGLGDMLRFAGRMKESLRLFEDALQKFPNDAELEQSYAWTLTFSKDWPAALTKWAELKRKFPSKPNVVSGITTALWEAKQELGIAESEGRPAPFAIPESLVVDDAEPTDDKAALKKMLLRFESLGDSCEFGIVQRNFGAEPIGLLRWATTDPPELTQALLTRLDGVGQPEYTVIEDNKGEYISRDLRYAMYTHTFTPSSSESLDIFTGQHLRRLRYLRRKLVEDLEAGKKIFVYKSDDGLPDDQAKALHAAIRSYNARAALLCVRLKDEQHPTGTIEELQEGLFIGYIDRYSTVDINANMWLHFCRETLARYRP